MRLNQDWTWHRPVLVEWIVLLAGLSLLFRYHWLMDDAFIYFRYIDNFLFLDIGLVYNEGENVEGFTSPFWLLLMAALRFSGMDYLSITLLLGISFFAAFWFLLVQINRDLSPRGARVLNLPLIYLGLNYGVMSYFSSGHETPVVQLLAVVYALAFVRNRSPFLESLIAISPLVRPELVLCVPVYLLWTWCVQKKFPLGLLLLTVLANGTWILFRVYYYADLLPNTYYLKDVVWWSQGLRYVHNTFASYHCYPLALLLLMAWYLLSRKKIDVSLFPRVAMFAAALPVILFVVKIGGDARHFRFLAFVFPLLVCALASGVAEHLLACVRTERMRTWGRYLLGAVVAMVSFSSYPPQLDIHPIFDKMSVHPQPVELINDAAYHRRRRILREYALWQEELSPEKIRAWAREHPQGKRMEKVQRGQSCAFNYRNFSTHFIHRAGLTDSILSRVEVEMERPAHKYALRFFADDIVLLLRAGGTIGRGLYRRSVVQGNAPSWIEQNISSIETLEKKVYNNRDFLENLGLALKFPEPIVPPTQRGVEKTEENVNKR